MDGDPTALAIGLRRNPVKAQKTCWLLSGGHEPLGAVTLPEQESDSRPPYGPGRGILRSTHVERRASPVTGSEKIVEADETSFWKHVGPVKHSKKRLNWKPRKGGKS